MERIKFFVDAQGGGAIYNTIKSEVDQEGAVSFSGYHEPSLTLTYQMSLLLIRLPDSPYLTVINPTKGKLLLSNEAMRSNVS